MRCIHSWLSSLAARARLLSLFCASWLASRIARDSACSRSARLITPKLAASHHQKALDLVDLHEAQRFAGKGQSSYGQDQDDVLMIPFATAEQRAPRCRGAVADGDRPVFPAGHQPPTAPRCG